MQNIVAPLAVIAYADVGKRLDSDAVTEHLFKHFPSHLKGKRVFKGARLLGRAHKNTHAVANRARLVDHVLVPRMEGLEPADNYSQLKSLVFHIIPHCPEQTPA